MVQELTTPPRPDSFTKRYRADDHRAELVKARLLVDAAERSSFTVPQVLDHDPAEGTITYSAVDCSRNLLDVLGDRRRSRRSVLMVLEQAGAALATIHGIEPPTDGTVVAERSELFTAALRARVVDDRPGPGPVLQHGDYGFTNIFVDRTDRPIVIDPSPNGYTSVHPLNLDAPELDLAILCSHLTGRVAGVRALGRTGLYGRSMVDAVLDGYRSAGAEIDRTCLRHFTLAGIDAVIAHRSPGSRAHRRAALRPISTLLARNLR